jgi:hypothetical protein
MDPPNADLENTLRAVARYKDGRNVSHIRERKEVYRFLRQYTQAWLGEEYQLAEAEAEETLFSTDHRFDAWLCALTAFAHFEHLTITWQNVEMATEGPITEDEVDVEGHILILK